MNPLKKHKRHRYPNGFTLTETLVAATLLVTLIAVVSPLTVRTQRMWQDTRHYRLAVDELSNQLERLTVLPEDELDAALAELSPSPAIQRMLAHPELSSARMNDADGARLKLSITWDRLGGSPPLSLVAWLAEQPDEEAEE